MLVSPALAICAAILTTIDYLLSYVVFVLISRIILSLVISRYAEQFHISFPFILYFNQIINASVKVYCVFRLHKQRRSHRGDQRAGGGQGLLYQAKEVFAAYLTILHVVFLFVFVIWSARLVDFPSLDSLRLVAG